MNLSSSLPELAARIILPWLAVIDEPTRARIHALTRKVTMTDEDLVKFAQENGLGNHWLTGIPYITDLLQDLRDRYEERGKYAPGHFVDTNKMVAESGTSEATSTAQARSNTKWHMTNADLHTLLFQHPDGFAMNALMDLRDRYEGLGKYAPLLASDTPDAKPRG